MATTKDGKALYLHCLPADITGVSCEEGEVDASVFDRYRDPLYKEASFKPYIIAAMIFLAKFENPQEILKKGRGLENLSDLAYLCLTVNTEDPKNGKEKTYCYCPRRKCPGNTLPEQMAAVKITSRAIVDLIQEGCEVGCSTRQWPSGWYDQQRYDRITHEDEKQPNTPLSVCVAMSQAYIGYDLQNALREELFNRGIHDIPVATMITQVRVDADDPAFETTLQADR